MSAQVFSLCPCLSDSPSFCLLLCHHHDVRCRLCCALHHEEGICEIVNPSVAIEGSGLGLFSLPATNLKVSQTVAVHAFNPSTAEEEAGSSLNSGLAWSAERVPEQPGLHREAPSQKKKRKKERKKERKKRKKVTPHPCSEKPSEHIQSLWWALVES